MWTNVTLVLMSGDSCFVSRVFVSKKNKGAYQRRGLGIVEKISLPRMQRVKVEALSFVLL